SLNAEALTEQEHLEPLSPTLAESPMQRVRNNITQFRKSYLYGAMGLGLGLAVLIPSLNSWNTHREQLRLAQNSLQSAESQRDEGQYEGCLATAETIPETFSDLHQQALNLRGQCLLNQAQELADENRLRDAIALAQSVPPDTEAAEDALEKIDDWFGRILQIAENKYQEQNLTEAINIASAVTNDSSLYDSTQELIGGWQAELDIWNQANEAFSGKQWEGAIAQAEKISDDSSLKELADELIATAQGEIRRAEAARQAAASQNNATTGSSSSRSSSGRSSSGSRPSSTNASPPPPPSNPNPPGSGTLRDF
ncbi:MAG: hypothetical protein VKL39_00385, partial [Leptolyngbyaceae bacterium]|nr:hypothetical protein [Leptolyngbyaceae bacterium]